jgi:hypothetical protein
LSPILNRWLFKQGAGEEYVQRYSPERKEALLKKLAPPYNLSVSELSEQEGTIYQDTHFKPIHQSTIVGFFIVITPKLVNKQRRVSKRQVPNHH